jgi:hypothetical protein
MFPGSSASEAQLDGHRPSKSKVGGSNPLRCIEQSKNLRFMADEAHVGRAPGYDSGGCEFEPRHSPFGTVV